MNGQTRPVVMVAAGAAERWHIVNVAKARTFVLLLPGHVITRLDGSDVPELSLLPGQCVSVDIRFDQPAAATVDFVTLDGEVSGSAEAYPILHVRYSSPREQS